MQVITVSAAEIHKFLIYNFVKTMCSRYITNYIHSAPMDSLAETVTAKYQPKIINNTLCTSLLQFFVDDVTLLSYWVKRRANRNTGAFCKSCFQP